MHCFRVRATTPGRTIRSSPQAPAGSPRSRPICWTASPGRASGTSSAFLGTTNYSLHFLEAIDAHPDLEWVGTANELNAAVERVIHGGDAHYNGIARWNWSACPSLFGASPDAVVRRVTTVGELDDALAACAEPTGNVSLIEVVLGPYDVPPALSRLVRTVAAAGE